MTGDADIRELVSVLEADAVTLSRRAEVVGARADAMDLDRDEFVSDIRLKLDRLRRSAGLPERQSDHALDASSPARSE
jgi:hypothetical protein